MIREYIEKRIKELNDADGKFCADRWDDSKSDLIRRLAREESNKVTFARQELESLLTRLTAPSENLDEIAKKH